MNKAEKEALEWARNRECEVCGCPPRNDACHLRSRGAGGSNTKENLMSLCRKMHVEQHTIGLKSFVKKYNLPIEWESTGWPRRSDLNSSPTE